MLGVTIALVVETLCQIVPPVGIAGRREGLATAGIAAGRSRFKDNRRSCSDTHRTYFTLQSF